MKIVQISDPHLVAPGTLAWGMDPADRLSRCLDDVARWHGDAAFCVITGDLTDRGDAQAYRWLKTRLDTFPLRTVLLLGNHDEREVFCTTFPDVPRDAQGFVQQRIDSPNGVFLFLDTLKGGQVSEGQYCKARQDWLAAQLASTESKAVYIFMHHPPCDVGIPYMDRIKLDEAADFARIVTTAGHVRHIFFGHVHRPAYLHWNGIACTCLPGTNHQVPLNQESVGFKYSREPAMIAVIEILADGLRVNFDACLDRTRVAHD